MNEYIIGAICTLLGSLIGAGVSFLALRFNYKRLFAKTVSENRVQWILDFRDRISNMLAYKSMILNNDGTETNPVSEYVLNYEKNKNIILSKLNSLEAKHCLMIKLINDLDDDNQNYEEVKSKILELTRIILKPEWERVKEEAKGYE